MKSNLKTGKNKLGRRRRRRAGRGQLTLAEHALCPLDPTVSLEENGVYEFEYVYSDTRGCRQGSRARIHCPEGLSPTDEFFLWGLLGLTFSQPEPGIEFYATPHYCLRQLGSISAHSKGGRSYGRFREAVGRLSAVNYQNDCFYDPIRGEHRSVSFGFLSYSLPTDPQSSRAWRLVWDPLFFEFCQCSGGQFSFDLGVYRELDAASRRLFLLLRKVFWRRNTSPAFDVRHLAVNVLGYSPNLELKALKGSVKRCIVTLSAHEIVEAPGGLDGIDGLFTKRKKGQYTVRLERGVHFQRKTALPRTPRVHESPVYEPLRAVGFDEPGIRRILHEYQPRDIQVWADITLAALERHGPGFFKRSPQAYFTDNVQKAAQGTRTLPDWWLELRKAEERRQSEFGAEKAKEKEGCDRELSDEEFAARLSCEARELYERVFSEMLGQFRVAGQTDSVARRNAGRFAREHVQKKAHGRLHP